MDRRRRWVSPAQPQTLQIAVFLLYFNAAFAVLAMVIEAAIFPIAVARAAGIAAGYGTANEKKWGYFGGLGVAIFPFLYSLWVTGNPFAAFDVLGLMFQIALVALLLHPQSREYQRTWFK